MKKGLIELVFILDRSGSMGGLESDTIDGFNGMLVKQKKEEGDANITTVLFDDQIEMVHDRFPIDIVKPLTAEEYYVRGCTALLDAIGSTVKKVENVQNRLPENMQAEKIIFVITTDGKENASQEYSYKMVKQLIEKHQERGWQFIFMGANMDAIEEAKVLGINPRRAVSYKNDSKGVELNYIAIGSVLSTLRSDNCCYEDEEETDSMFSNFFSSIKKHLEDD